MSRVALAPPPMQWRSESVRDSAGEGDASEA